MKFYHLVRGNGTNPNIERSLKRACLERDITYHEIDPVMFNPLRSDNRPGRGDLFYRSASSFVRGINVRNIERLLVSEGVATLYGSTARVMYSFPPSNIVHSKAGLPVPMTISEVRPDKKTLKEYVEAIHGFPIIVKVLGGSHGVGVIRVDTPESLYSLVDLLLARKLKIVLRQYIKVKTAARLIVLGTDVIGSLEYVAPPDDFRSNVGQTPEVHGRIYNEEINGLAVAAVRALTLDYGGVDILIDEEDKPYIVEVNFPCNFARAEQVTGCDIGGKIIEWLKNKTS